MIKKISLLFIILISLSLPTFSQVYDTNNCSSGSQSFKALETRNPQDGNLQANACIDPRGILTFPNSAISGSIIDVTTPPYNITFDGRFGTGNGTTVGGVNTFVAPTLNCNPLPAPFGDVGKYIKVVVPNIGDSFGANNTTIISCDSATQARISSNGVLNSGSNDWEISSNFDTQLIQARNDAWNGSKALGFPCGPLIVGTAGTLDASTLTSNNPAQTYALQGCAGGIRGTLFTLHAGIANGIANTKALLYDTGTPAPPLNGQGSGSNYGVYNISVTTLNGCITIPSGQDNPIINTVYAKDTQFLKIGAITSGGGSLTLLGSGHVGGENYFDRINAQQLDSASNCTGTVHLYRTGGNQGTDTMSNSICAFGGTNVDCYVCGSTSSAECNLFNDYFTANNGTAINFSGTGNLLNIWGGIYVGTATQSNGILNITANNTAKIFAGNWSTATASLPLILNNGKLYARDVSLTPTTAGFSVTGTGTFFDNGNIYNGVNGSGGPLNVVADSHSVKGTCTGVATASSTLGLYGTGPNETTTTCTSATIGTGIVVEGARTLQGLYVSAGTGGVNASSGVVTVLQNGVATTLTCTLGTGTVCTDSQHSVTLSDGDKISIQFTTQAGETLANVKALTVWN